VGALHVASLSDHLMELIDIFVDGSGPLEVSRSFEIRLCYLDLVLGAKLADELLYELPPCVIGEASDCLVTSHMTIDESSSTVTLHEGKRPHDPRVVISELMRYETHVQFTQI
jgi:hypothetical protein